MSLVELYLTNKNVKTISNLGKAVYGCKNILKRGKKRQLLQHILSKSDKLKKPNDLKRVVQIDFEIERYRLIMSALDIPKDQDNNIFLKSLASNLGPHNKAKTDRNNI